VLLARKVYVQQWETAIPMINYPLQVKLHQHACQADFMDLIASQHVQQPVKAAEMMGFVLSRMRLRSVVNVYQVVMKLVASAWGLTLLQIQLSSHRGANRDIMAPSAQVTVHNSVQVVVMLGANVLLGQLQLIRLFQAIV